MSSAFESFERVVIEPCRRSLGERLTEFYGALAARPMPVHLVDLVDQLETAYQAERAD